MWVADPVSTALDPKTLTLGIFVLTMYVTTSIVEFKMLDRINRLLNTQNKQQDDANDTEIERVKAVSLLGEVKQLVEDNEEKLDEIVKVIQENKVVLDNIQVDLHEINKQQTILATAQLNQSQSTNRVIDGLLEALSEHSKE